MDWKTLPPLAALRAFAAYAERGSVQSAGEALNVSHAAISQQIRKLESHLGLQLLDRSGRAAELTPQGRLLAQALADGFAAITTQVAALTGADDARPLHVATTPSFAANWLMPRLADFRAAHPGIDIVVDPNPALTDPRPGHIDVALRYGAGVWEGLETEMLLPTGMAVVAAPSLIGDRRITRAEDLSDLPWLQELGTSESSVWLAMHNVTRPLSGSVLHLPGNLTLDAARSGQGVAVTAKTWVEEDIRSGRLLLLFEEVDNNGYFVVTAPGVYRPALREFLRWLRRRRAVEQKS